MEALLYGWVFLCGSTESGAVGGKMLNSGNEVVLILKQLADADSSSPMHLLSPNRQVMLLVLRKPFGVAIPGLQLGQ